MRKPPIESSGGTINSVPQAHKGQIIRGLLAGLLPLFLVIPAFAVGQWGLGLAISVPASFIAVGTRLLQHKPVTGLGVSSLGFSVLLAIGYFGFGSIFFVQHFGVVICGALLIQVLYGEIRGQPFTAQFSKQMIATEHWNTRSFLEGNRFLSRLWGVIFAISILWDWHADADGLSERLGDIGDSVRAEHWPLVCPQVFV